jgi:hypothetical protein
MDRTKNVARNGFETQAAAMRDALNFSEIGGKVSESGVRADGSFGWTGAIEVHDAHISVEGEFFCGRCAGTGAFITYVENGVPKGPGGDCFRCNGKGFHNHADRKRNWGYDLYGMRVSL